MKMVIEIGMNNVAFGETELENKSEVANVLRHYIRGLEESRHGLDYPMFDGNGNVVGVAGVQIETLRGSN